jgi:hypothetical protein
VAGWTVDKVLDHLETRSLPQSVKWIQDSKRLADKFGLKLVAYEGGQHMLGIWEVQNNEAITRLLLKTNAHPRLAEIYRRYFDAWEKSGGDLFCYFTSVGVWSKFGSWGLLQYYDDDPAASPKLQAVMRWASSRGQRVSQPK